MADLPLRAAPESHSIGAGFPGRKLLGRQKRQARLDCADRNLEEHLGKVRDGQPATCRVASANEVSASSSAYRRPAHRSS